MFLSEADLLELTGYEQPAAQIRWLVRHAVAHDVNARGRAVVLRATIERRHGLAATEPPRARPNLAAILP